MSTRIAAALVMILLLAGCVAQPRAEPTATARMRLLAARRVSKPRAAGYSRDVPHRWRRW